MFDAPGAGRHTSAATRALSINTVRAIAGYALNANNVAHGFVRDASGTFATIAAPGTTSTEAFSINTSGVVAGHCWDGAGEHGFVRAASGAITIFDAPARGHTDRRRHISYQHQRGWVYSGEDL